MEVKNEKKLQKKNAKEIDVGAEALSRDVVSCVSYAPFEFGYRMPTEYPLYKKPNKAKCIDIFNKLQTAILKRNLL